MLGSGIGSAGTVVPKAEAAPPSQIDEATVPPPKTGSRSISLFGGGGLVAVKVNCQSEFVTVLKKVAAAGEDASKNRKAY